MALCLWRGRLARFTTGQIRRRAALKSTACSLPAGGSCWRSGCSGPAPAAMVIAANGLRNCAARWPRSASRRRAATSSQPAVGSASSSAASGPPSRHQASQRKMGRMAATAYSALTHLECSTCRTEHKAEQIQGTCTCCAPLLARYDLEQVKSQATIAAIAARPPDLWRYHELLPVSTPESVV